MLSNKKKILIASLALIILIAALVLAITGRAKKKSAEPDVPGGTNLPVPQYLTTEEKAHFKLADNIQAQVLARDASGTPTIYRLINAEEDVITDPTKIGPLSPRQAQAAE